MRERIELTLPEYDNLIRALQKDKVNQMKGAEIRAQASLSHESQFKEVIMTITAPYFTAAIESFRKSLANRRPEASKALSPLIDELIRSIEEKRFSFNYKDAKEFIEITEWYPEIKALSNIDKAKKQAYQKQIEQETPEQIEIRIEFRKTQQNDDQLNELNNEYHRIQKMKVDEIDLFLETSMEELLVKLYNHCDQYKAGFYGEDIFKSLSLLGLDLILPKEKVTFDTKVDELCRKEIIYRGEFSSFKNHSTRIQNVLNNINKIAEDNPNLLPLLIETLEKLEAFIKDEGSWEDILDMEKIIHFELTKKALQDDINALIESPLKDSAQEALNEINEVQFFHSSRMDILPLLTDGLQKVKAVVNNPTDQEAWIACEKTANEIGNHGWGRRICAGMLVVAGVAMIFASVALAASTFGMGSGPAILGGIVGASLLIGGLVVGGVVSASIGSSIFRKLAPTEPTDVTQTAMNRVLKHKPKAEQSQAKNDRELEPKALIKGERKSTL